MSGVSATAQGETSATVSWNAPTVNADKVTDYTVQFRRGGTTTWLTASDGVSTATEAEVRGLQADTSYDFRVRAEAPAGSGPYSDAITLTTGAPDAPTNVTVERNADINPLISWTPPTNTGSSPISDYQLQFRTTGSANWITITSDGTTATPNYAFRALQPNTSYDFRVRAINNVGAGNYSTVLTFRTLR